VDNAAAESFFATLTRELEHRHRFPSRATARLRCCRPGRSPMVTTTYKMTASATVTATVRATDGTPIEGQGSVTFSNVCP
jgi:hypothetical protein